MDVQRIKKTSLNRHRRWSQRGDKEEAIMAAPIRAQIIILLSIGVESGGVIHNRIKGLWFLKTDYLKSEEAMVTDVWLLADRRLMAVTG